MPHTFFNVYSGDIIKRALENENSRIKSMEDQLIRSGTQMSQTLNIKKSKLMKIT